MKNTASCLTTSRGYDSIAVPAIFLIGSAPIATFREDGTCTIRKADGLWTLDYVAYYNEKYRNGWDYCLHAKINGDEYDICFSDYGAGQYHMYIINQDDGIYILDVCDVIKLNAE